MTKTKQTRANIWHTLQWATRCRVLFAVVILTLILGLVVTAILASQPRTTAQASNRQYLVNEALRPNPSSGYLPDGNIAIFRENGRVFVALNCTMPVGNRIVLNVELGLLNGEHELEWIDSSEHGFDSITTHPSVVDVRTLPTTAINTVIDFGVISNISTVVFRYRVFWWAYMEILGNISRLEMTFTYNLYWHIDGGLPLPQPPTPPIGHYFAGWYFDEWFIQPFDNRPIFEDTVLHARFNPITYTIAFVLNDGNFTASAPTAFNINSNFTLPVPVRIGHHFRGWYTNANFSGQPVTEIATGTIGNRNFYARWELMQFTVTFMVGGAPYHSLVVYWGTVLSAMTFIDPMTGQLARLYLDETMTNPFNISTHGITGDTVVFTDSSVTVFVALTHNIAGETTTHLLPHGESLGLFITANLAGFNFEGWYYDEDFTRRVQPTDQLLSNTTIYARFSPIQYYTNGQPSFFARISPFLIGGGAVLGIFIVIAIIGIVIKKVRGNT